MLHLTMPDKENIFLIVLTRSHYWCWLVWPGSHVQSYTVVEGIDFSNSSGMGYISIPNWGEGMPFLPKPNEQYYVALTKENWGSPTWNGKEKKVYQENKTGISSAQIVFLMKKSVIFISSYFLDIKNIFYCVSIA